MNYDRLNQVLRFSAGGASHETFHELLNRNPTDETHRNVYADWIEENDPASASPETITFLRNHKGKAWVTRNPEGKVKAGRHWTIPEIRAANAAAGGHWFARDTMRYFGTRVLPTVYSGPGGVYFVHENDNYNRTARELAVAMFHPKTGEVASWTTYHRNTDGNEFVPIHPMDDRDEARELAKSLAKGTSPYPKNSHFKPDVHGPDVDPANWGDGK